MYNSLLPLCHNSSLYLRDLVDNVGVSVCVFACVLVCAYMCAHTFVSLVGMLLFDSFCMLTVVCLVKEFGLHRLWLYIDVS